MKSKRLLLLLLMAIGLPWAAQAQETVTIGTGTTNTTYYTPFNTLYNYSFVEQIYLASEITVDEETVAGTISEVRFYHKPSSSTADKDHDIVLYMKNVTRSTFSGTTDYEVVTASDIVFNGSWTITGSEGWVSITLDTPFVYDGESNLLVAMDENSSGYSTRYFTYTSTANTVHGYYSDGTNPDPYNLASFSGSGTNNTVNAYRANMQLVITPSSTTATPPGVTTNNASTNLTNTSVTLGGTITDMGGANSVQAGICWSTTNTPTTSDNHAHSRHTSAEAYTQDITGLLPNTTYYYRAYAYNSANSVDDPTYGDIYSFTTACNITLDQPANGAISASVAGGAATTSSTYALPGQSVTLTATVVSGYSFDSWIVSGVTGTASGSTYTFTMPSNDVTATASIVPTSGGSSSEFYYELATSVESGAKYLVVNGTGTTASASGTFYAMEWNNTSSTSGNLDYGTPTFKDSEKHKITDITPHTSGRSLSDFVWTITASGSDYTLSAENGGSTYYLIETSASDGNLHSYTTSNSSYNADQTKWKIEKASGNEYFVIHNAYWYSQYSTPGGRYYYLYYYSGFKNYWDGTALQTGQNYRMYLYKETSTTTYAIVATANPTEGGTVAGSDYYANGASCTLTATPAFGYDFVSWTENGTVVSTDAEYTFTVSSARTLVANFESQGSCIKPTDVAQVANTEAAHQAQLSWTENNEATQWEVVFSTDSEFDPDAATPTTVNDNPTVTIPSLAQETTYYVYVRAICGENSQSGWSNKATFTTISGRQAPTVSYDESTLTDNSVTITWTGVATNVNHQSYDLYYSTSSETPSSSQASSYAGLTGTSKELTGLSAQTTYYVWVRDNCGTDGTSDWSEVFSFRTACGIISNFPWKEDFEGFAANIVPDCWDNSASTSSTLSNNPAYIWGVYSGSSNKFLRMYNYFVNNGTALVNSPSISVPSEGTYELTFKHSNRANCGALSVKISEDGGTTFVEKGSYDATGSTNTSDPGTFTKASIPLTDYAGKTIIVQFFATANYSSGSIFIDDVEVKELVVVTANQIVNTVSDPATQMTWDDFVTHWNNGDHFTSTTFTLMDDITVSTMAGTSENPFTGTFEGNDHTITVNLTATDNNFTAPFRIIKNATIQNLKVDGTINDGGHKFCAGFAGDCYGNNTFTNCESDVTINATIEGDGTHGGFIARNYGSTSSSNLCVTTFNGCAFTGKLLGENTNQCGGFCGWSEYSSPNYARTTFNNCVFDPEEETMSTTSCATFARRRNASYVTITNCYYTSDFNDGTNNTGQGKQAYTITGASPVTVAMSGTAIEYSVSGITAYSDNSGLLYNGTIYAGEDDIVNLTLSGSTTGGYQASEGVLERDGDNYNILMDANDTEISVDPCPQITGLTVSNITAKDAKVSWDKMATQATGDITYQVIWAEAGQDPDWNSIHVVSVFDRYTNEHAPYCTANNYLESETEYVFYVRRKISQNEYCDAVATETFTTLSNCSAPAELNATSITANSATLSWSGAQESYNVRYREVITAPVNIDVTYGFEDGTMQGWTTISNDNDNNAWSIQNGSSYAYGGSYYARAIYTSSSVGGEANDWLISPQIPLGGTFSFYARRYSTSYTDRFQVYVSTTGNNISDFTAISDVITPNATYGKYEYDLSSYTGNGYVAIVYTAPNDQYYLYVDDIHYTNTIAGEYDDWNTSNTNVTSPLPINGLEANTTYEWQVQGINTSCTDGLTDWSEMATFNTPYPTFTKTIEAVGNDNWAEGKGGYYLIASPLAADVAPTAVSGMITDELGSNATTSTSTYDLYSFDQNPADESGLEWRNYRVYAFDLVNGQGYLYASKNGTTLTFTGMPLTGDEATVELAMTDDNTVDFQGWNLVGNPFGGDAYLKDNRSFYTMQNAGEFTSATGVIHAMDGVFVIAETNGETLTFTTTAPSKVSQLNVNLTKDNSLMDRAIVRFDEGSQLPKLQFRKGSTKVYIPQEGKDYAVVRSEEMGAMPVNFKAEENGSYTLSFTSEEVSFAYLHLIDNMTGEDIDLLAGASTGSATYTFDARTTDYESRFKLVFATGNSTNDDAFAFFSNGSFVINNEGEATLQVIDVNGRILKSESINGCANVNVKAAAGVYVLRLVNGNDVKVQKVVVR